MPSHDHQANITIVRNILERIGKHSFPYECKWMCILSRYLESKVSSLCHCIDSLIVYHRGKFDAFCKKQVQMMHTW